MEAYIPGAKDHKRLLAELFSTNGQVYLPILELLIDAQAQLHDFTHAVGIAAVEGLLELSATQLAGAPHPGKATAAGSTSGSGPVSGVGPVRRHGHQNGVVCLGHGKLRVKRPRLRTIPDAAGKSVEVEPPGYTALKQDPKLSRRIMEVALGGGVSTRKYKKTLERTAAAVGISKSAVSRAIKQAMTTALEELQARVIPGPEILAVYVDGFVVGSHHVIGAIGVKKDGTKLVLGVRAGGSENLIVVTELLTDLRERGLTSDVPRLFVLDGAKALHSAVDGVYGDHALIQRCRNHKLRNVLEHLPQQQRGHAKLVLRAAFNLEEAATGIEKLTAYAAELERGGQSSAAGSLREGLGELFTVNALGLPSALRRCLGTTNLLDAAHSGTRGLLRRVSHWQDEAMAARWVAAAMVETEKHFKKIQGCHQLWMLEANLKERLARRKDHVTGENPASASSAVARQGAAA
jgi:transposase-like protein